jgi:DNA-binding response OmpR family regulator
MVLTARNNAGDVAKAVEMGARDFLSKPFNDMQLVQRVGRLLSRPRVASS